MGTVDGECSSFNASRDVVGEVKLPIDGVVWQELCREAERQRVDAKDLAAFALLYYLADADSGRIARKVPNFMAERAVRDGVRKREG